LTAAVGTTSQLTFILPGAFTITLEEGWEPGAGKVNSR